MVVIHCSDLKDDDKCLRCSLENQATTLNIYDYSIIITDNKLPNIYGVIDKKKNHKGVQEQQYKPLFTMQDNGKHHDIKNKLLLSRQGS